ncbi:DUF1592 domain-containing protein [Enhygromyxa salina]|uniref:Cellulose-binding domain protein n=1 Tax=Enhygromyxa salina TaxID=215803 RepID=A0A2S9XFZ9_9BACT|nr:DUF1592 domain-containing protein [Enhygromyxa salina]PRP91680.1 hypothetical protein ENSA7_81910 [Enhygromyxa salina]
MRWLRMATMIAASSCLMLPACKPGSEDDAAEGDATGETGGTGDGDGDGECLAAAHDPGPAPLRRLTARQYANTVRDLFPGVDLPEPTILLDPLVAGFENNAAAQTPSALLIEQYQRAAVEITEAAIDQAELWLPCASDGGADPSACGQALIAELGPRMFRRPLSAETAQIYAHFFETQRGEHGFSIALQLTLQAMLQAPEFIYFVEQGEGEVNPDGAQPLDGYTLATRLSYFIWDTMPDEELFAAAAANELGSEAALVAQVERMLADPRARESTVNFYRQWFDFDSIDEIVPDLATYPDYTPTLRDSMKQELERLAEWTVFDLDGNFSDLMLANSSFVDAELAGIYGVPAPGEWALTELDPTQRAGMLTSAGFLASRAHAVNPSPVKRGVFVLEHLLCQPPPPPPPDVSTEVPEDTPADPKTNRERYQAHTVDPLCQGCHVNIDGIGFGFEHYDSLGRWRDTDNGFPVDATGTLIGSGESDGEFDGAIELAAKLASSEVAHDCAVTNYLRWALARSPVIDDRCFRDELEQAFLASEGNLRALVTEIILSDAFRLRRTEP